jgi:hypothetical protein
MRVDDPHPVAFGVGERKAAMAAPLVVPRSLAGDAGRDEAPVQRVDIVGREVELGRGGLAGEQEQVRVSDREDRHDAGAGDGLL